MEIDLYQSYPHVEFLEKLSPKGLKDIATNRKIVYFGIGQDVWLPFGVLNAKDVVAYDMIDPVVAGVGMGYKASFKEKFYGYAKNLISDIESIGGSITETKYNERSKYFEIKFVWRKGPRYLKVFVKDIRMVLRYPKAYLAILGTGFEDMSRLLKEVNPQYFLEIGEYEGKEFELFYPGNLFNFWMEWETIINIAPKLTGLCKREFWNAYDEYFFGSLRFERLWTLSELY